MDIFEMLGVDLSEDPDQRRALAQVHGDSALLDELVIERKARMTQQEVAHQMGITQSAVARIESGDRDPRLSTLARYAGAIGVLIRHEIDPGGRLAAPVLSPRSARQVKAWDTTTMHAGRRDRIRVNG